MQKGTKHSATTRHRMSQAQSMRHRAAKAASVDAADKAMLRQRSAAHRAAQSAAMRALAQRRRDGKAPPLPRVYPGAWRARRHKVVAALMNQGLMEEASARHAELVRQEQEWRDLIDPHLSNDLTDGQTAWVINHGLAAAIIADREGKAGDDLAQAVSDAVSEALAWLDGGV